ncbi:transposase family protein [Streptomyces sp. S.PB5]|uniref:transposase family protein n=1 Tax=Streptomyces sp. S.PB5 TaxID=3020844 RepID=UPI0025B14F49|nr:transposase family protein [Streptomyces sp. S.PB5]MDN3027123.1 transposase family protein [Streptomyces sp. S.PB5]
MRDLSVLKEALLPEAVGLMLDRFTDTDGLVVVEAHSSVGEVACPDCAEASRRVHSRYQRRLAELPVGGRRLVVRLMVRRFFCDTADCPRRTFVAQVEGLTSKYARAGPGVKGWWRAVALAVGGRPGTRLCRVLAAPTGRARLFGQLQAPAVPSHSPRVLGIDDFAFRRSRTHGTTILDVEQSTVIDVLPDRASETLAAWLTAHPGPGSCATGFRRHATSAADHTRPDDPV